MKINKHTRTAVMIALAAVGISTGVAQADGRQDYYAQQAMGRYFDVPTNARQFGMAGSNNLVSLDSSAVANNPAALGLMQGGDVSASYSHDEYTGNLHPSYQDGSVTTNGGQVFAAIPINPTADSVPDSGSLGLGWSGYSGEGKNGDPYNTDISGGRVYFSYGKALSPTLAVGYGLALVYDELKTNQFKYDESIGFRHTLGVAGILSDLWSYGATAYFGHGNYDFTQTGSGRSTDSNPFEFGFDVGTGYKVAPATLVSAQVGYGYYKTNGGQTQISDAILFGGDERADILNLRLGVEQSLSDMFKIRGGFRYAANFNYDFEDRGQDGSFKYVAWTAGAGVVIPVGGHYVKSVNLDYGVEYRAIGDNDFTHYVTASVPFNLCK